ncbi:LLM class flavin-dependent oxidoreductase [Chelatococcus asaccharovorans]|uniref:Alkanesulfonate monooxygenase SsuD/methylene tetrahydromethanopterin reductase-like flavin-dependent oxidoreductase (Luciferase family) n=1 Tax=Chelatococcus asaccharovorans TaxID=28210 RepID=A0A2V3TY35_9HYPH|nr:LLM class flavin-dependent oxidoreductase [Chelatococcus asaccharovorans]MBS7705159.1 LLM class flavin-dependent oxidoreductase [Chelatococcus asaccharovorans]PXW53656.1 alkanesulfonate monooxygenase SsuD/methylene tetrahydromethanopterin reductase-like flavin-dependent oxidoreductase (luciferase family) [Chelatococcus asaccharovorans]CAH1653217.1 Alkanesulfonate monooxygenase SsuD/methylene tetrahydromethanopterin reductase-like flavin-dependent oxidoreductase (Luciferase family) [Chelatococ
MSTTINADDRRATNPVFNDNRLKLGLFGLNSGQVMTKAPDRYIADWKRSDASVKLASDAGLEAIVALITWHQRQFDTFTWCAALGARHPNPAVVATFHVQLVHPTFVAKAAATGDHITDGRFCLNVVAGSNSRSYQAFGMEMPDHETRYAQAAEYMELLKRLWTEDPFDFEGRHFQVFKAESQPKPVQSLPPIMNAGTSERGVLFAAKYADMVFTHFQEDMDSVRAQCASIKKLAWDEFRRPVQVWTHGYIVIRDTDAEAEEFLRYFAVEHADQARVAAMIKALSESAYEKIQDSERWKYQRNWAAGGGVALVGSPETVARRMAEFSAAGVDGILLNSIEPESMVSRLTADVLPLLEQAGVRKPFRAHY